ncbi:unnamed protein product [Arabis nemorensis]|uniref:Neprosin domain-containing protein n=1 Tax=Arabis nemorensis TaxID=586526 RepID=A0A565CST7_9BRAS|nr:unnamed protein product [Arabis nemorensis]
MEVKTFLLPLVLFVFIFSQFSLSAFKGILNNPYVGPSIDELGHHAGYAGHATIASHVQNQPRCSTFSLNHGTTVQIRTVRSRFRRISLSLFWNDFGWDKVSNISYVDQLGLVSATRRSLAISGMTKMV